ncbi:non-ribosomal peptide synthase/polyketide synthase [Bradyrhizobium sp. CIAT3101]|nr:non-ribosomal peptide synthase/polyketide synthase [Bradyrhizobium sp. CIAT3101]WFU85657.1 non-ribosomal peptide synthase/polyketide synthase [Bradyrhizobium sp. CIAT3101]
MPGALAELSPSDRAEFLLTAWVVYLARITGEAELQLGWTPVANGSRASVNALEVLVASVVPMAITIDLDNNFAEARTAVAAEFAQLNAQDTFARDLIARCPSLRDVEALRLRRPWPVGVTVTEESCSAAEESVSSSSSEIARSGELVTLEICALDGSFRWHFDASRLESNQIERMTQHLQNLLCAVMTDAQQSLRCIGLLSSDERTYLLEELNPTATPYPSERCIHELFEAQVRKAPDAVAVVHADARLKYGELNTRANRLAYQLIAHGMKPGDRVAIVLDRGIALVVAQLAVLKAGGLYVPIDRGVPVGRQSWIMTDCAVRLILVGDENEGGFEIPIPILAIEPIMAGTGCSTDPGLALTAEAPAYVMYTSGSTGLPKAVVVPHRAVNRLVINNGYAEFTSSDRVAWVGNPAFSISTLEVWAPLLHGSSLTVIPHTAVLQPEVLRTLVRRHRITVLHLTAGLFSRSVDELGPVLASLRFLLVGGGAVDAAAVARVLSQSRPQHLLHCYGSTETSTFATVCEITAIDQTVRRLPIGRPIANTRVYLLDGHGAPVPFGAAGELYIGGAGVARGYLNRPELTAERFMASPFVEGDRLYRTGDLARYLPDGNLEFLGRNDDQVKIRGFRIEPGEIAARIAEHPFVRDAVVVAQQAGAGEKRLVAYVVCAPEAQSEEPDGAGAELAVTLRAHVGAHLPDYMVPAAFVRLAALPLTVNGKLDRKALPAPDDEAYAHRAYEAPQGEVEITLAQIWAELLGLERVGRHDHFFELGGHSLLAVQMIERLRRRSLRIEVRTLFLKPVLADLAASLGRHHEVAVPANLISEQSPAITPEMLPLTELTQGEIDRIVATVPGGVGNIQDIYGLSPLQDGILFHHLLTTKGDPYLLVSRMAFADRDLLERYLAAVQRVVDRHDILRTSFVWEGLSRPAQVVWRRAPLEVSEVELDGSCGPGAAQLKDRFDPRRQRIELGRAPLLRFVIAREPGSARWLLLELQHHLIGDHTTLELMHTEVRAVLEGREHELAAPQPFRNLVAAVRLGVGADAHEEFFRGLLGDIDEPCTPFGLCEVQGDGRGTREAQRMLPQALNVRLRVQARRLGVSLASLCHLAWGQVVARSSDREQVVFGTVLFGRMHGGAGGDRAMGLFINTLPLRLDLDGTGVEASVRTTHARLAELLVHEHASLALAQRCSGVAAPAPLFSALLNYRHNTPAAVSASAADDVLSGMEWLGGEEITNYPLTLSVEDFGEALGLTAQVAEGVSADRVCGYMQHTLAQLAEALERAPNTPVRELDILPPDERAYLLEELNRTAVTYPEQQCIHELFEAQVRQAPDAVAVVYQDQRVSYGELNARANQLARHLIGLGVTPDQPVAICVARSVAMVVGLLAILKAGGAYLPLDPAYPSARLHQVLADAAPQLLLADAAGRSALGDDALLDLTVVDLAAATPEWANLPAADPDPRALGLTSRHLAYVIYTSGSTGTPKGVMVEHRSLARLVAGNDFVEISPQDVFLNASSPTFDATTFELWGALANGASVVLYPERYLSTARLAQIIQDQGITIAWMTARLFDTYTAEGRGTDGLQQLLVGGEEVSVTSVRACQKRHATLRISNAYGPTENTTFSLCYPVPAGFDDQQRVPLGRPIRNSVVYLLDRHGAPVPFGAVGELYIGGAGVARGYLNRPELTAERFMASPFVEGDRLYRTGDLARYLPDGNLEFLGRNDDQVKIRGFRIEPGEIAARIAEHPFVRDAVVVAQQAGAGEKRLVAYVVCAPEAQSEEPDGAGAELAVTLRAHVGAHLPDYMVPAAFVRLAALPLTVNGKLDRKALPAPDDEAYAHRAYEAPQGEVEITLAQIWAELLGLERVGRHDHFFELGGHSLLAVQMIERLRRRSLRIEVRTLFLKPVLADLAASLGRHHEVAVPANLISEQSPAITPEMLPLTELTQGEIDRIVATVPGGVGNIQDIYGLSPLQDGILFHHLLTTKGDPYLLVSRMAFADRDLLERYLAAVQRVVDRHDILRTSFVWEGLSRPAQVVWRRAPLEVSEVELDGSCGPGAAQLKDRFDPRRQRIELGRAPLLRFVIAREPGSARWLLLELQHHLIGDHTTLELMHTEVRAVLEGREHELAAPQPFRNLVAAVRLGVGADAHEEFFRGLLGDIDEPCTPFGLCEVQGDGRGTREAQRMLPQALNVRLRVQARRLGVSLASLCHLAWGQVVARSSDREQVVFGTVLFGRMHGGAGGDRAMGLFINTLPLRLDLDGTGVEASVRTTHARLAELLVHEHASLALAQRCSGVAAPAPLFSALLNYRHNTPAAVSASAADDVLSGMEWLGGEEITNYPLTLSVEDFGEALGLTAQVAEGVSADRVCGYMQHTLAQLAEALERAPNTPVRELDILPPDERAYLLEELNRTAVTYPEQQCIHELFEAQVRQAPDAVAVVYQDQRVSYGELNARANQLARHLIGLGVTPDQPVAICVARSVAMVVGLLAILKAGGAYLPLDPAYPSARLHQALADAAPQLLLADAAGRSALGDDALLDLTVVDLTAATPEWANLPAADPDPRALGLTSRHLAYVIYTSGSTGTPKGAQNEHRAIVNRLIWMQNAYGLKATDVVLQKTPFGFDVSAWEFFWTLLEGATLVLAPTGAHRDPDALVDLIVSHRITTVHFVPSMLVSFLDAKSVNRCTSLRRVLCSGEALPAASVHKVRRLLPWTGLHNLYGPTEAAIDVTAWSCPDEFDGAIVPIGRPIANTRVYLLDGHGAPVPFGAAGELYIGGAGVARGYLNRPELTAERFMASPFVEGDRLYRTGDLARYLPDGNLEFLGRNDDQVKIRGFRIEPGEIAARVAEHPYVREAVVVAHEGPGGEQRLVGYVVCAPEAASNGLDGSELAGALRAHISAHLPDYMVPAAFVRLAALPLTVNGKLDRKALPAPDDEAYAHRAYEAPQGEVEITLAQIWAELLGLERVGRHDHFFALGGHSLLAVQLLSRVSLAIGFTLPLTTLFAKPVLADLAASIMDELSRSGAQDLPAIVPVSREAPLVLSFAQQRLWFLAQLDQSSTNYHIPLGWRLEGGLDRSAWQRSLDRVLARHEALRSVFVAPEGKPWVELLPEDAGLPVVEHDVRDRPDADEALLGLCIEEARTPFDLARGPLIRGRLIRISDEEHVLLLTQHHIVSDGWSLGVLVRELSQLYRAFVAGEGDPLPPLAIQYPDYAAWQRQWLSGERLQSQAHYWRNNLSGAPARLALPTDRPRPAEQSFAGASVMVVIGADLTRDLKRLSRQHDTTLFMTVLAAWAALLSRLSGQDDLVIGVPSANRGRREVEELIGCFVNTLALRLDLSGGPSVAELLARTRRSALGAQEHQDLPFEQVVEIVQPPRRLDHTPLFQVMLAWQNNAAGTFDLPGLRVEAAADGFDQVKFDLELNLCEHGEVIAGTLGYATALFDQATIERHRGYLLALLQAMVADARQTVGRIELLAADERAYLLEELNRTAVTYPEQQCIHELFEAQVHKSPDAVAVVYQDQRVSYGELNARANQLAHHLIGLGVTPDQPVAICVARSVAMVVGLLAILKAGGAYLPLDPAYPSARLHQVLADAAPQLLLADAAGRSALGDDALLDLTVVDLTAATPEWANLPAADPDPRALGLTSRHLAYVIYTSGSTGTPKGVMIEHASTVNLLHWSCDVFAASEISRTLFSTSISFDLSVYECFVPLSQGSTLYLVENALALAERSLDISLINTVPSAIAALVDNKAVPVSASVINSCGERLKAGLIEQAFESSRVEKIYNLYAPSETTTYSTWICLLRGEAVVETIGRPIANTRVYLLDGCGAPVPFGAVGELYIGGAGVARGYLNRPELTAERFIASPFVEGDRLYRTGDLARYLPDGNLEFLGRNDDQVKIRGFRIEPGEIAARVAEHPFVREAVVVAAQNGAGDKHLIAYVVCAPEAGSDQGDGGGLAGALRAHLSARLPDYMVPSAFVRLAALPLTVNGKLDRKALPAPADQAYALSAYEAPQGVIETALAQIWAELLGVERIGRSDHFFELGGHSLLAVQMSSRLSQAVGVDLPLSTLFARPVLSDLAASTVELLRCSGPQELPSIAAVSRHEPLVLSFAQQRLWFLAQLNEGSTNYHIPLALRLRGMLDHSAWQRSLDRLFARHEALRSVFVARQGKPRVEVLPPDAGLPIVEHDLRERSDAEAALLDLRHEEGRTPFDLARGPLIRGRLVRMSDEEHVFLLTQHHIVSDGWSMGVLLRELSQLYRAFEAGHDDPLPPLAIQYPDYAAWQRQWLSGERLQKQAQYWHSALAGTARLVLPTDRARPAQQSFAAATVPIIVNAELTRELKRLSLQHGTTLFMTLLAAWAAVLSRLAGQDDLVIGVPSANRGYREIEGLIGFFVNTLALRLDLSGKPRLSELLERTRRTVLAAQEHQDLPFEQVVEIVQPPRALDHTPLFQVMLAWENNPVTSLELPGLSVETTGEAFDQVKFDLELSLGEHGEEIAGTLGYATALFDQATIERQRGYLLALLRAMAADAQQAVHRIELLSTAERTYLLEELNRTAARYPAERCIHELFEAQVHKSPDAVALVCEDERLSYGELNARANRLAHHLIALGVRPDQPVAIGVARSVAMVVGLLAILKAGGAYLPLDPAYPLARLHQVLDDAAPLLLLADVAGRAAFGADVPANVSVVELDAAAPTWTSLPEADADPRVLSLTSRNLAYVIYTSGSTGTPKGAQNEHRAIVNRLIWMQNAYGLKATDVVLQKTPFGFDVSAWEFFWTLLEGATLVLAPTGAHRDPDALVDLIVSHRITTIHFVPSMLVSFLDTKSVDRCRSLRRVLCSGEALSAASVHRVRRVLPWTALHNLYGPTEAAIDVTSWSCPAEFDKTIVPIGRPIANTRVYLLDGHGAPVPFGAVGELYIGGAGVARDYLNRPELTAERFIASPFVDGDRLYRTGDLGRYLPDGNLEFLGRNDDQVKIRGFRIEPGEIAARVAEHPYVREAVVVAHEGPGGEQRLVGYVVCAPEAASNGLDGSELAGALRAHISAHLPDYMVPAAFVRLAALPLTVNGKLDRKALPAPDDEAYAHRAYEAPQGEVEITLAQIWAELLGLERVGRHDHFFELGGHSLLAVQMIERLRRRSLRIEVRTLFLKPVLADLAASLGRHHEVAVPANLISEQSPAITPEMLPLTELTQGEIDRIVATVPGGVGNIQDIYGLSPLQDGILFHHLLTTKGDPYLLVSRMAFADRDLLERYLAAVQRVVDRHDILRTSFVWEGLSRPAQVVWRRAPLEVSEVELDGSCGPGAAQLKDRFDPRRQRIELGRAPLLRFVIAREPGSARWLLLELQHHLIGDHTTLELMHTEVRAVLEGREHELAAPQPFRNLVAAVRLGVGADAHEEFFRGLLGDIDEPCTPFGLCEVQGDGRGTREAQRMLPQALNVRLRVQARRLGVSLASLCHLAWGQVVARSSDREQVVFGTVLFGRMHGGAGGDRAMGLFINTLPLRLDLDGTGVEASVRTTHARLAELLVHEHASLALAQRCSGVAAPAPLFSALLNYRHNTPAAVSASAADDVLSGMEWLGGEEITNYPLTLSVEDFGEALGLTAQVAEGVSADRVCGYMQHTLAQLAEALERAPNTPVRELDILPPDERAYLLEELNRTAVTYPEQQCIHELFEAQVRQAPDAVAVVYQDQRVSYGELNARANQLARHLIGLGVTPDQPVAICVARSVAMVVGLLAILKAGGAYLPLDPAYPSARLHQVLADAAPQLLLADAAGRSALGDDALLDLTVVDLTAATPEWANLPAADPDPRALGLTSRHLAYVIYTSGSTGTPKGVRIEHASTVNLLHWSCGVFAASEISRTLFSTSISFDLSVYECFVPLSQGSTLYLIESALTLAQTPLDVSLINTVPSAIASLVDNKAVPASTRVINLAGERLKADLIEKAFESSRVEKICNLYAPSETTTYSTWICMRRGETVVETIGRPIANTRVYLLDGHGAPVPFGAAGELYIGGAGVARGYLNRPELTAERFMASPFVEGDRLYRTGDLARYLPDGNLEFLGRNDDQVKIRGFRIEPGEIAARVAEHPYVREAVVVAHEGPGGEQRLVGYVVCAPEAASNGLDGSELAGALRAHISAHLPDYMVPAAFVRLAALPLTVNGKLDRKALPAPDDEAYAHRAYEAPQGEVEITLAQIWAELLGVERVGRHDHFFALGGHSLLAVQLLSRVSLAIGFTLPLTTLFAKPVLADLAASIMDELSRSGAQDLPAIVPVSREAPLVLSFAQQRLWFLAQLDQSSTNYHIPLGWRLEGGLDRSAWQRSLDRVLARHEALRSVFVAPEGKPWVELLPEDAGLPVVEHDVRDRPDADEALLGLCIEEARTPFDLARGPLIRGRLIRISDEEHVLLLTQHHIVSDGWSLGVLVRELSQLYRAFVAGEGDPLPPLAIQYPDYAAWQRQWLSGERLQSQAHYWRNNLSGAPARLALPTDRPRPAEQSFAGASVMVVIGADLTRDLKRLSRQHDTTLFMTVLAAWAALLSRLSGQDDLVIGVPSANRGRREVEELIGCFVNTLALRLDLSGGPSVAELLARTRRSALGAQEHQDLPFEQVVEIVQPPRRLDHTPLFQVMLAWQNNAAGTFDLPGLRVEAAADGFDQVKFDLELNLCEHGEVIAGTLGYATALFDQATIERHRGYLLALLQAMVADARQTVGRIELLAADERAYLLEELNRTAVTYPEQQCIHELFEAQVHKSPDAVAVVYQDQRVSYGELNARANQLAHHLIGLGVTPDQPVAICVARSVAMVVGLLAILKAGGAYLPLDPAYPSARLHQVLADAAPQLLLADAAGRSALGDDALLDLTVVDLTAATPEWANLPAADPDPRALGLTSRHLAYVIYTSGSTGTPKGAQNEHRAIVNRLIWMQNAYGLKATDVVLQKTPFGFDVSAWEFFWTLLEGATLVLAPPDAHRDPAALVDLIIGERITTVHFVPSMLVSFMDAKSVDRCTSLRRVLCSGEALPAASVHKVRRLLPWTGLHNLYGPTEAAIDVTAWSCPDEFDGAIVPIGRPIANTRVYLLDGHGAPVPFGAAGELYIGGAGVARGYLNRPELTAERFMASPFVEGDRLYRTGDLARYLPDGNLEFLGRNDDQVKIRGFRIEPGEIAARVAEHPFVREAVVVAQQDGAGEKRLVAYVVCAPEAQSEEPDGAGAELAATLRAHISAHLPDYMVPAAFVRLAALPLTVNGKLDRKALPAPDDEAYAHRAYEAPQGEVEITLAQIWAELLGVERVGRHDHFFALGGHSLLAVQLISRAQKAGLTFSAADLFQAPVLRELASKIHLKRQPSSPQVISVLETGSQPPLFFVPTGLGDCSYVLPLVKEMDVDCPVYALPWPHFDDERPLTLQAIAAEVMLAAREIQPHGPYRFAGYSSGAILTYAIAQHLVNLNEAVSFMALMDAALPANRQSLSPTQMAREVLLDSMEFLEDDSFQVLERFAANSSIGQLIQKAQQIGAIPQDRDLESLLLTYEKAAQFQRALDLYEAPSLGIEINQFYVNGPVRGRRARGSIGQKASSPLRGWDRVLRAEAIHAVCVPGDHTTMMNTPENRRVLAQCLSIALNNSPDPRRQSQVPPS